MREKTYEVCPVCGIKKLTGGHGRKCRRDYPVKWVRYYEGLLAVSLSRCGRSELEAALRGQQ